MSLHTTTSSHHRHHPSTLITVIIRQHPSRSSSVNTVIDPSTIQIGGRTAGSLNWNIRKSEGERLGLIPRRAKCPEDLISKKHGAEVSSPLTLTRREYYHYYIHTLKRSHRAHYKPHSQKKPKSSSFTTPPQQKKPPSSSTPDFKDAFEPTVVYDRYKTQKKPKSSPSISKRSQRAHRLAT
jgi:hypothetical protein